MNHKEKVDLLQSMGANLKDLQQYGMSLKVKNWPFDNLTFFPTFEENPSSLLKWNIKINFGKNITIQIETEF